jgi:hypothetical protein
MLAFLNRSRGTSRPRRPAIRRRRAIRPDLECCEPRALLSHAGLATPTDVPGAAGWLRFKPPIIIAGPRASVTSVISTGPNGLYGPEEVVGIAVNFTRPVFVIGVPELALNNGAIADYTGGSSTIRGRRPAR